MIEGEGEGREDRILVVLVCCLLLFKRKRKWYKTREKREKERCRRAGTERTWRYKRLENWKQRGGIRRGEERRGGLSCSSLTLNNHQGGLTSVKV